MKYFKNLKDQLVYGYDPEYQQNLIDIAVEAGWQDITDSWPPAPTDEERKLECKYTAKKCLLDTDFSQIGDVSVILVNKVEFDLYRNTVRSLFLNPVNDPQWPVIPKAIWK